MKNKLEIVYLPPEQLKPYEKNTRKHSPTDIEQIKASIEADGFNDPIGIWSDDNIIIEGHGRQIAALEMGLKTVPCIRLDHLTDTQRRDYAIRHNRTAELSDWDLSNLEEEIARLEIEGVDLSGLKFDFNSEFQTETGSYEVDEEEIPEVQEETIAKRGDVWQLGRHRLICGDSTDPAVIDRLMDGVKAHLLLTDPPYGTTAVEWDCDIDLNKMWSVATSRSYDDAANVIFSAQPFTTKVINSNVKEFRYEIIWVKTQKTGFYNANRMPLKAHENILVFYRKLPSFHPQKIQVERDDIGRRRAKKADRCVLYGHVEAQDYVEDGTRYPSDVIEFSNWNGALFGNNENATVHPTQKPIELLSYLIRTYSNDSDVVLDLFGGSGSTLIACEQLNRRCYMAEIAPKYCDVIIQRWENFTGEKAVLLNG